jgi:hypothetical protein
MHDCCDLYVSNSNGSEDITNAKINTDQIAASLEGFFWPKFFFDFYTKNFDAAVKPIPILQTINLVLGIITLAYEWPLKFVAGTAIHQSLEVRMVWLPFVSLSSVMLYQATNPALYYLIGLTVYCWAYTEGEVSRSISTLLRSVTDWAIR